MLCILKSCGKCCGDLVLDEGDWRCMQCARYYHSRTEGRLGEWQPIYPSLGTFGPQEETPAGPEDHLTGFQRPRNSTYSGDSPRRESTKRYRARAARNINSLIQAKSRGDARWWDRNRQLIEYLDRGLSVREISMLTERGERQVRTIRERLADLRASSYQPA